MSGLRGHSPRLGLLRVRHHLARAIVAASALVLIAPLLAAPGLADPASAPVRQPTTQGLRTAIGLSAIVAGLLVTFLIIIAVIQIGRRRRRVWATLRPPEPGKKPKTRVMSAWVEAGRRARVDSPPPPGNSTPDADDLDSGGPSR